MWLNQVILNGTNLNRKVLNLQNVMNPIKLQTVYIQKRQTEYRKQVTKSKPDLNLYRQQ